MADDLVVREWDCDDDDDLIWPRGDMLFNDRHALTAEHNAVARSLKELEARYLAVVAERDEARAEVGQLAGILEDRCAELAAVTAERDDLRRINDSLTLIIGGPEGETAEPLNYEIVDVVELQAKLTASEAARGHYKAALEKIARPGDFTLPAEIARAELAELRS